MGMSEQVKNRALTQLPSLEVSCSQSSRSLRLLSSLISKLLIDNVISYSLSLGSYQHLGDHLGKAPVSGGHCALHEAFLE